jgi:hypothetical protein
MQERRLRLGDVLDDYCPREKRLSNHVIVALVGDEVRTTRCATCDFEHVYKEGKVPARRKKADPQAVLYKTVLDNVTGRDAEAGVPVQASAEADMPAVPVAQAVQAAPRLAPAAAAPVVDAVPAPVVEEADAAPRREEPIHRHTLIRATLPKIEGQVPERKPADFTSYARPAQGRRFGAGGGGRSRPHSPGNANWGGYSPYANGHPSGKGPQQGQGGQPGKSRPQNRRGR